MYPPLIRQKTATTCGQCCIAMLCSCSIEEAIQLIGHDGITSDVEMHTASGTNSQIELGKPPFGVVSVQKHKSPNDEKEHWTLWWRDRTLDPANIGKRLWPVYKYFIIDWI